jgi:two-component SAPR family response regulator
LKDPLSQGQGNGFSGADLGRSIGQVLADHVPEDHLLVIDNVGELKGCKEASAHLDGLIHSMPAQTTLILAGRRLPELALAELAARDEIKHFGPTELALTLEEMIELVNRRSGEEMAEPAASELYRRTEGWLVGVLLSEWLQPEPVLAGSSTSLVDQYLEANVLKQLPAELQSFAIQTSMLPIFSPAMCDHLFEREGSRQAIEEMIRSGSLIFREGFYPGRYYRYQRQFGQFLSRRQSLPEQQQRKLIHRAVDWYQEQALPDFAFELAIKIGDFEIASSVATAWASRLYVQGKRQILEQWASKLKARGFLSAELYRVLALNIAFSSGDSASAWALLDEAEDLADEASDNRTKYRILGTRFEISMAHSIKFDKESALDDMFEMLPEVDVEEHGRYHELSLEYRISHKRDLPGALKYFRHVEETADPVTLVKGLMFQGIALGLSGRLKDSYRAFSRAKSIGSQSSQIHNRFIILVNLATTAHYLGRYFEAFTRYSLSIDYSNRLEEQFSSIWGVVGKGELLMDLGYLGIAEQYLQRASQSLDSQPDSRFHALVSTYLSKCLRKQGRFEAAKTYLQLTEFSQQDWRFHYLAEIERALTGWPDDPENALEKLRKSRGKLQPNKIGVLCVDIEILKLQLKTGMNAKAKETITRVLKELEERDLDHFLVIEAANSDEIIGAIEGSNSAISDRVLKRINEFNRIKDRFQFVIPEDGLHKISIRALGEVRITNDKGSKVQLRPVHQEVLFYLLESHVSSKYEIIEAIWPNLDHEKQSSNLHSALYQIRKELGGKAVVSLGANYQISNELLSSYDAYAFQMAANEVLASYGSGISYLGSTEEAISLYRGDYLPGFYSNWIISRRNEMQSEYCDLIIQFAEITLEQNATELAIKRIRSAVRIDPLNERLAEAYVKSLIKLERYQELISFYRKFEKQLADELQVRPSSRIIELVSRFGSREKASSSVDIHLMVD